MCLSVLGGESVCVRELIWVAKFRALRRGEIKGF